MCAILDANVAHEVFQQNRPPAGEKFFDWINKGQGSLVVGGKLHTELDRGSPGFRNWARQALLAQRMRIVDRDAVETRTEALIAAGGYKSDDPHVIALAQVSGARLLYSNDKKLREDFTNPSLIHSPEGRIYSTLKTKKFNRSHKWLLATTVCRMPGT